MKFKVAKQDLTATLSAITPVLSTSGSDLSTHYLFRRLESDPNKMEVLAFSGKLFASCSMVVQFEDDGKDMFTIDGKRFQTWLKGVPDKVIVFDYADQKTIVTLPPECKMTVPDFPSLDASKWPFWDASIANITESANVLSIRLRAALEYAKKFTAEDESKTPDLCMCAVKDGLVYATDRTTAAIIEVVGLEKSNFCIHKTELGNVINFLPSEGNISIREYDKGVTFWREDGAMIGCGEPLAKFPYFKQPADVDQYSWTLGVQELLASLPSLYAWADEKDIRLNIMQESITDPVTFSMKSISGNSSTKQLDCLASKSVEDAPAMPAEGFAVSYKKLQEILGSRKESNGVAVGVNPLKKSGYLRFVETRFVDEKTGAGGDKYLTLVVWLA
jgi:DNA polymerase III sliding clamp (beta) subunit (PCNA family)